MTDSLLAVINPSPPGPSLPLDNLDSMPPPEPPTDTQTQPGFAAPKRRSIAAGPTFPQLLSQRASQPFRSRLDTLPASQIDSDDDTQRTYDDVEDREERQRAQEASRAPENRRSRPQQKDQEEDQETQETTKRKPSNTPEEVMYKLNMELFWENDKTAFHLNIQRQRLYGEHPPLHTLLATQDGKAHEKASELGHVSCHRVSLVMTLSDGSLSAAKTKHFNIANTDSGEHRQVMGMAIEELMDWKHKKELQISLVYRYARNRSGIIEKEPAPVKTTPTIITHSGRNQDSRSISLTEVPTSSNPTGRLLSAHAEEDVVNPAIAVRRTSRLAGSVLS